MLQDICAREPLMYTQNCQQPAVKAMPDKLTKGTAVIIDNCFYSRMAIEILLSEVYPKNNIYSFECLTDYKNWDRVEKTVLDDCSIILNTSSSPLYGEDVSSFLWYEKMRAETEPGSTNRHILLLTQANSRATCQSVIITHYLQHASGLPQLTMLDNVRNMSRQDLMTVFRQLASGKKSPVHGTAILSRYQPGALRRHPKFFCDQ